MPGVDVKRSIGAVIDQGKQEHLMPFAAVMVHVDIGHSRKGRASA